MLVLGMSTSTPQVGVAIGGHEGVLASWHAVRGRHHAELLTPAIAHTCDSAGVALADVGVVAVDVGPGLFTGLRVGVATAKAVATALGVPMIGVSSLDLLAFTVRESSRPITAVIDARRGELFVASYVAVPGGVQRTVEPHTASPDELSAELLATAGEHLLIGNGARRYADVFASNDRVALTDAGSGHPSAAALVQLAHAHALREEWVAPTEIRCAYLRQPDVEINWQTRDGAVSA
jgi:tRNA threonylcarbamoyladenosine biosynthesis protein TsaB